MDQTDSPKPNYHKYPLINFRLDEETRAIVERHRLPGESFNLACKRLLIERLYDLTRPIEHD